MNELKKLVYMINHEENFERAQGMLKMLNAICGTRYGFLSGRVVRFENPDGSVAERFKHCHDLYVELD